MNPKGLGRKRGLNELVTTNLLVGTEENHVKSAGIAVVSSEIWNGDFQRISLLRFAHIYSHVSLPLPLSF